MAATTGRGDFVTMRGVGFVVDTLCGTRGRLLTTVVGFGLTIALTGVGFGVTGVSLTNWGFFVGLGGSVAGIGITSSKPCKPNEANHIGFHI